MFPLRQQAKEVSDSGNMDQGTCLTDQRVQFMRGRTQWEGRRGLHDIKFFKLLTCVLSDNNHWS